MKSKNIAIFMAIVLLIAFSAYITAFGLPLGKYEIVPVKSLIKLGLDLRGGATVLLQAKDDPNDPLNDEKMERAVVTIRERVDSLGVAEPTIVRQGNNRIEVQLPEVKDSQRALEVIGQTAQLEFRDENGTVVLTGADVENATVEMSSEMGTSYVVSLKLNPEGATKFKDATASNVGKQIGIYLDNSLVSNPTVDEVIPNGEASISGIGGREEALDLATVIRAGALPVELEVMSVTAVGPQLGANSFSRSLYAGAIGIIVVLLFMLAYYRLPGLVADITLTIYIIIVLMIMAGLKATLTLPGIAGIILSVGMAVDANVIIFERIKEEIRVGKTLRAAVDSGFRRAFITILDSNVTTVLAATILFYFGAGPIKGFAITLMIGIATSMFTAIVITRYLMMLLVKGGLVKNTKYFGV
ncbi:MAG: protein translocase subunit SecD [Lutisporaceae bacterium]